MEQLTRRGSAQRRSLDHCRDLARERKRGELVRELEAARFGGLRGIENQMAHRRVEFAQDLRLLIDDRDAERVAQSPLDRLDRRRGRAAAQPLRQLLRRTVDAIDIVAGVVEPVANLFPRQAAPLGGAAGQRLVDDLEPLPRAAIGCVQRDELVGELRLLERRAFELFGRDRRRGEERVGGSLPQRPRAPVARIARHLFPFEREQLLQPVEQRRG